MIVQLIFRFFCAARLNHARFIRAVESCLARLSLTTGPPSPGCYCFWIYCITTQWDPIPQESDSPVFAGPSVLHDGFSTRFEAARPTCPTHIPWPLTLALGDVETGLIASPVTRGARGSVLIHKLGLSLK